MLSSVEVLNAFLTYYLQHYSGFIRMEHHHKQRKIYMRVWETLEEERERDREKLKETRKG